MSHIYVHIYKLHSGLSGLGGCGMIKLIIFWQFCYCTALYQFNEYFLVFIQASGEPLINKSICFLYNSSKFIMALLWSNHKLTICCTAILDTQLLSDGPLWLVRKWLKKEMVMRLLLLSVIMFYLHCIFQHNFL